MRLKHLTLKSVALSIAALSLGVVGVFAQDAPPLPGDLIISQLNSPRGIAFDAAGNLLVVDAGSGGETPIEQPAIDDPTTLSTMNIGLTGAVYSVTPDGTNSPLIIGLPSYAAPSETVGLYRAIPNGDSLWLVFNKSIPGAYWSNAVVELDATTLNVLNFISFWQYEVDNNPDGNEIDSNVTDIDWAADGTLLITDAGANTLYAWTAADGLAVVQTWSDNSVPTAIEVADNGDVYIGFLGAGLAPGAAKIERWSNGELAETFSGLNAVTDILLTNDTIYAVELVIFGAQGPGAGRVVSVNENGINPVVEGLFAPFALAQAPDGGLYVSFGAVAFGPNLPTGVLRVTQ